MNSTADGNEFVHFDEYEDALDAGALDVVMTRSRDAVRYLPGLLDPSWLCKAKRPVSAAIVPHVATGPI